MRGMFQCEMFMLRNIFTHWELFYIKQTGSLFSQCLRFLLPISSWTIERGEQSSLLGLYKSWRSILSFILWGMFQHVSIHCYMEENFLNQIIYQSISTLSTKYLIKVTCPGSEIVTIMKISSSKCIKFYITTLNEHGNYQ